MATLYTVDRGSTPETLDLEELWQGASPLGPDYIQIVPLALDGKSYVLAFNSKGKGTAFEVTSASPYLAQAASLELGRGWDIIEPFLLGNASYLLCYEAEGGQFSVSPLGADLSVGVPFSYFRGRAPGVTKGFSVTQPLSVNGLLYILTYSSTEGTVNAYSLQMLSTPAAGSPEGSPAMAINPVWLHQWARDWTRFAFFRLGGENFFLKTNTGKLNVNIDHVLDDPSDGTVEVGTYLTLENALDLSIVRAFYLGGGDPYFVAYQQSGATTLYRFHGDCQGWTKQLDSMTVEKAAQLVPVQVGDETMLLFY